MERYLLKTRESRVEEDEHRSSDLASQTELDLITETESSAIITYKAKLAVYKWHSFHSQNKKLA